MGTAKLKVEEEKKKRAKEEALRQQKIFEEKEKKRIKKERGIKQFEKAQIWRKQTDQEKEDEIKERFSKYFHLETVDLARITKYADDHCPKKKKKNRDMAKLEVVAMDDFEDELIEREKERIRLEKERKIAEEKARKEEEERLRKEEEERKKAEEEKRRKEEEEKARKK